MLKKLLLAILPALACLAARGIEPSGTIPILYINTEEGILPENKDDKFSANRWIESSNPDLAIGSRENPQTMTF